VLTVFIIVSVYMLLTSCVLRYITVCLLLYSAAVSVK